MHWEHQFYESFGKYVPGYSIASGLVNKAAKDEDTAKRRLKNGLWPSNVLKEAASNKTDEVVNAATNAATKKAEEMVNPVKKQAADQYAEVVQNAKTRAKVVAKEKGPYVAGVLGVIGVAWAGYAYWRRQAARKMKALDEDRFVGKIVEGLGSRLKADRAQLAGLMSDGVHEGLVRRRVQPAEYYADAPCATGAEVNEQAGSERLNDLASSTTHVGLIRRRVTMDHPTSLIYASDIRRDTVGVEVLRIGDEDKTYLIFVDCGAALVILSMILLVCILFGVQR
ncbi:hypothetical protein LTR62_000742 [Meristemomyces frigidus]|uniref:Uncharacterized protein n=1 Tax=Meristemomyces frigidus TaxID=1508187 RepID=A0AAN7THG4_9PEZI|nr:hypothetical protein LTR62_000742 [Meristemomyces frigidus]